MLAQDDQKTRLALAHPGLPFPIGLDVRPLVVKEVGLDVRLARGAQEGEFVRPKIRAVELDIGIRCETASATLAANASKEMNQK